MTGGAVAETFPSCDQHIQWVALGSIGWSQEVGATYGANNTPVAGGMPGFAEPLTEDEIAAVVLYERVTFGGLEAAATEADCFPATEAAAN